MTDDVQGVRVVAHAASDRIPALSVDLMARALDSVADAVIITDAAERIVYWNAAAEALYGHSAMEACGQIISELVVPVDRVQQGLDVLDRVSDGDAYQGEWLMRHKDGRLFPVHASTNAIVDPDGVARHFIGVSRDASREKEAFRTAQTLASVVAHSADAIFTCDTDGVITWANDRVVDVFGWSPGDLVGRSAAVLVEPAGAAEQGLRFNRTLQGDRLPAAETRLLRREGTTVEVRLALGVLHDENGTVCGTSAVVQDLTLPNALRRDVARQTENLRARFEQAATPQTLMDMGGNFVAVNDAYCDLLGRSRAELLQMSRATVAHVSDSGTGTAQIALLQAGRAKSVSFEKLLRHADGHAIPVLVDVTVLHDDDGTAYGMASFIRDLRSISDADDQLTRQRALFRALNQRASDVGVIADADMVLRYVSPSVGDIFGYAPDEVVGRTSWSFVHPDDLAVVRDAVARVMAERDGFERITVRIEDRSGVWRWVEKSITNALADPEIRGVVLNLREVTAEVHAKDELRRSEARYRAIAETAQEGMIVFTPVGDVIFVNQKLADLLGHSLVGLVDAARMSLFDPETEAFLWEKLRHRSDRGAETYEVPYHHPDGTLHTLSFSAAPLPLPDTDGFGSLAMVSDVTEARRAERELRHRSAHDVLTDLPNRALLVERIRQSLERSSSRGGSTALLFLDLDHFKLVNDSRGHAAGDLLLIEIGRRLRRAVRPEDTVARLGGDEFAVLCSDVDETLALTIAGRLRDALASPVELGGPRVYVDASIGIALSPPHDAESLLRFADVAMYEAKATGRGRIQVFDDALALGAERRLRVMNLLREALEGDRLCLHYQPIVDIVTGSMHGVEALLRWEDPELGRIAPLEVVEAADATGLSMALDRWVIYRACREMVELRDHGLTGLQLSVNVSARSFAAAGLDEIVARATSQTGWSPRNLTLEVTESAIMTDTPCAIALLHQLKEQGVVIAIDDFGTGYSSLAYLKRLPVSVLKIDRSFIDQVTTDADSRAIVRSVVQLAEALGMDTVAEGIETAGHATTMVELGCPVGQGHYWSRAVPADQLPRVAGELTHLTAAAAG